MARRKRDPSEGIEVTRIYKEKADDGEIFSELIKTVLGIEKKFVVVKKFSAG